MLTHNGVFKLDGRAASTAACCRKEVLKTVCRLPLTRCTAPTTCVERQRVSRQPGAKKDRQCKDCWGRDEFSSTRNADKCTPHSFCGEEYVATKQTAWNAVRAETVTTRTLMTTGSPNAIKIQPLLPLPRHQVQQPQPERQRRQRAIRQQPPQAHNHHNSDRLNNDQLLGCRIPGGCRGKT